MTTIKSAATGQYTAHASSKPNDRYMYGITVTGPDGTDVWFEDFLGWEPDDQDDMLTEAGYRRTGDWQATPYGAVAPVEPVEPATAG